MAGKPVMLAVDDDTAVLQALALDLRRRYAERYRILRAGSGAAALDLLRELRLGEQDVALIVADHRMPGLTGIELLEASVGLYPGARTVLLTAYADTDVAIRAINTVGLDHYLLKPWSPPEERLYPVLDDLLDEWQAQHKPAFDGVRLIGHRWSARAHEIKDLLARNHVPFEWLDIETSAEAHELLAASQIPAAAESLPVVVTAAGKALGAPANAELAVHVGLKTRADLPFYDVIIVGGGPAGLAAAVYGSSEGLRVVLVEREAPGGQASRSSKIENYLGFHNGVSGARLAYEAEIQARRFGAEIITVQDACQLEARGAARIVRLADGTELNAHTVLIATGVAYQRLLAPGLEALTGRGVFYGATPADAQTVAGQDVYIVGGANSAGQAAVFLAHHARQVTLLIRGDALTRSMSHYLIQQVEATPTIRVRVQSEVTAAYGEDHLEALNIVDHATGQDERVPADALYIFVGASPNTDWVDGLIARDERGFLLTGSNLPRTGSAPRWPLEREPTLLETNVPGIFVAGDVRQTSMKRVASAVGEGAMAVHLIHRYLAVL